MSETHAQSKREKKAAKFKGRKAAGGKSVEDTPVALANDAAQEEAERGNGGTEDASAAASVAEAKPLKKKTKKRTSSEVSDTPKRLVFDSSGEAQAVEKPASNVVQDASDAHKYICFVGAY